MSRSIAGFLFMAVAFSVTTTAEAKEPVVLRVLGEDYPRAYFFRASEGLARRGNISYQQWEQCFSRLMGIEGKVLAEELPNMPPRNLEFFTRFKRDHPEQLVLLHYNGNACDPRFASAEFFAGHWLYFNGERILSDVPAEGGETEIEVERPNMFRTGIGRYRNSDEDIGLCMLDDAGKPDWHRSEQVQLVSVDVKRKRIRVRRGCYGTRPRAFPAGKAYAAAHVTEGPWGRKSNLMWLYNYATCSPRDRKGRACRDVLVKDIAARFAPDGKLASFDGVQFDVLKHELRPIRGGRGADCNADGVPDAGVVVRVNQYGVGVVEFCRKLRAKLGQNRLILADGMSGGHQRAFGILNGIESEGWPSLSDWEMRDWSGGLNRHFFWQKNARKPVFNYINHKYVERTDKPGVKRNPDVPPAIHRLVFAVAMFTDSAVCYALAPPPEPGELLGIWDELRKGTENRIGWLGKPAGPPVRLAQRQRTVLTGGVENTNATLANDNGVVKVTGGDGASTMEFRLRDIRCDGPDLFVSITVRGEPMSGYPKEVARQMRFSISPPGERRPAEQSPRLMSWLGRRSFTSHLYFPNVQSKTVDLHWEIEGNESVWLEEICVRCHPDAIYRVFEHGLVLANPSPRPYTFDLAAIAPDRSFRRLRGSTHQDPETNNGKPVEGQLTLGPKDALFLVEEH